MLYAINSLVVQSLPGSDKLSHLNNDSVYQPSKLQSLIIVSEALSPKMISFFEAEFEIWN